MDSRVSVETLQQAAEVAGGQEALARRFNVPEARLRRWMAGFGSPPLEIFLAALDIVAAGPALLGLTRSVSVPRAAAAPEASSSKGAARQDPCGRVGRRVSGR